MPRRPQTSPGVPRRPQASPSVPRRRRASPDVPRHSQAVQSPDVPPGLPKSPHASTGVPTASSPHIPKRLQASAGVSRTPQASLIMLPPGVQRPQASPGRPHAPPSVRRISLAPSGAPGILRRSSPQMSSGVKSHTGTSQASPGVPRGPDFSRPPKRPHVAAGEIL